MTIQEQNLLKSINKLTHSSEKPFFFDPHDSSLHLVECFSDSLSCCDLSKEINGVIQSLQSKGYLSVVPSYGLDSNHYCLTHKGIHYLQFTAEALAEFLFKSVLIPVIVSLITAIITVYIAR